MKRVVIVHCWGGIPNYAWYPWVKSELEAKGYQVIVPAMPDTDEPQLSKWLPYLQAIIGEPDDDLVLVGHSIGTVTIMRYLESLGSNKQVGKVIMVAGFTDTLGFKELENFFESPLDFQKIKAGSQRGIVVIQSDNDPFVSAQYGKRLKAELNAKLIIKTGAKHMSGALDDEASCSKLPEVVEEIV